MATNGSSSSSSNNGNWIQVHKPREEGDNPWRGNKNQEKFHHTIGKADERPDNTFATWCIQDRKIIALNYTINGPKFVCFDCEKKELWNIFETLNYVIYDWITLDIHHIPKQAIETYLPNKCLICKKDAITLIPTIDCPKCEEIYLDLIKQQIKPKE